MGLMDILNGMQNGPRGRRQPDSSGKGTSSGGGMSPLTMALIGLLAYKAMRHFGGPSAAPAGSGPARAPQPLPDGTRNASASEGGLGDLLKGGLGGLLAGGAAGSVLSGGLNDLLKQFEQSGHGEAAKSWVGTGPNKEISSNDLEKAIGVDTLNALAQQTGLSRSELAAGLSDQLPELINQLTPEGRVPSEHEMSRLV
jgi:uncharacterized protein YidB (DUF937 family)